MKVIGLDRLIASLTTAATSAPVRAEKARSETKIKIRVTARANAPFVTGEFHDGIVETADGVEATAPHSPFVEFGTSRQAPQPTLLPAADQHEEEFVEAIAEIGDF